MRLYPAATNRYIKESGVVRTASSKKLAVVVLRGLQNAHPEQQVHQFTSQQMAAFCLSGTPAPNTVRTYRNRIMSAYEWFKFAGIIHDNPATDLKYALRPTKNRVRDGVWLDETQRRQLLDACGDDFIGRRDRIIALLGMLTGIRRIEMSRLRWSDFDDDMSSFTLLTKGDKRRVFGVPDSLREELLLWRQEAPADAVAVLPKIHVGGFGGERNRSIDWSTPISNSALGDCMVRLSKNAPVDVRCHDLRRTFAGILDDMPDMDITDIRDLMGHESVATTEGYLARNPKRMLQQAKGIRL